MFHLLFAGFGLVMGVGLAIMILLNFRQVMRFVGWSILVIAGTITMLVLVNH